MSEFTGDYYDEILEHHGILGQKWGVRRYQNEDGSLTDAGRERYGTEENFQRAQEKKKSNHTVLKAAALAAGVVAVKKLSDANLGQKIHDIRASAAVSEGYEPLGVPGFSEAPTRKGGRALNVEKYAEVASNSTTFIRKGESGYDTKHISSAASGISMRDLYELYKTIS